MKKLVYTFFLMLLNVMSAFAEYDGRWYSVEDHHSSPMGGFGLVIAFVIGIICAGILIATILKDENRDGSEKGCLTIFFVVIIVAGFIAMLSQCQ